MVEQDLVISRALISIYNDDYLSQNLAFRGGTALNKLYLKSPARYSEDIDLTQIHSGPIGPIQQKIMDALSWLGNSKSKLTERSLKLVFPFQTVDNKKAKLKIEINTTEHFSIEPLILIPHKIQTPWFSGEANVKGYTANEMMASKLKALHGRKKGRDLFDLWIVLKEELIDPNKVLELFNTYCERVSAKPVSRAEFEKNLANKYLNDEFKGDMTPLLSTHDENWSFENAFKIVHETFIKNLNGDSWKLWDDTFVRR